MDEPDAPNEGTGPAMLVCTPLLRPGPARIGSLGKNVHLPRSVQVNVAVASLIMLFPGLMIGFLLSKIAGGFTMIALGGCAGAFAGYLIVSWSPFRRESLLKYAQVTMASRQGRVALQCEGSGTTALDITADVGTCAVCRQEIAIKPDRTCKRHEIRRKVFVGLCPLPEVVVGEVKMTPSMIEVDNPRADSPYALSGTR